MVLRDFLKKLFCLDCSSTPEAAVSLVDFALQEESENTMDLHSKFLSLPVETISYLKVRPLTSLEV